MVTVNVSILDEPARKFLFKFAKSNLWRVGSWMDFDDLVQLGYESYYESRKRYPGAVDRQHIMRLFQLVFRSKIENLVRAKRKQIDDPADDDLEAIAKTSDMISPDYSDLHALLILAPSPIKDVVALLIEDKNEEISKPLARSETGRRETMNERLCGLLGLNPSEIDVISMTREYFSSFRVA